MERVEQDVNELREGVIGTLEKPGIAEMMRKSVETLSEVKTTVDSLKTDRWILRGIAVAVGAIGSLIGWFMSWTTLTP